MLHDYREAPLEEIVSIQDFIPSARLRWTDDLDITPEKVQTYNMTLETIFDGPFGEKATAEWSRLFEPAYLLRYHDVLYQEIIGK